MRGFLFLFCFVFVLLLLFFFALFVLISGDHKLIEYLEKYYVIFSFYTTLQTDISI